MGTIPAVPGTPDNPGLGQAAPQGGCEHPRARDLTPSTCGRWALEETRVCVRIVLWSNADVSQAVGNRGGPAWRCMGTEVVRCLRTRGLEAEEHTSREAGAQGDVFCRCRRLA